MDRNAYFWQTQDGRLPPPRAATTLGIEILKVDAETGTIEAAFDGREAFTNPAGNIQGGFLAAMLDDTMGPALAATLAAGEFAPTLDLHVQFMSPAVPGRLLGKGRVVRRGGKVCFLSAELLQDGRLVASATATPLVRKV
ncbi:MAG TPA: PaaI family thioesterase [Noviherbaspirillum sp.]|nr:PaaI family thioesterase [Noviherbaspirillum sp.]